MVRSGADDVTWGVVDPDVLRRIVVVSPHFDDAALGAAHLLSSYPGSTVITVLGGRPPAYPPEPTSWDACGGFRPGDDVVAARREEDRAAMACLEASPVWLEFPDHQYLTKEQRPRPAEVGPALQAAIVDAAPTAVFLPLGLANPDHALTHDAGLLVRAALGGDDGTAGMVLLRGRRLQAHPRHSRLARGHTVQERPVAHPGGGPCRARHGPQARRHRALQEPDPTVAAGPRPRRAPGGQRP